MRWRSRLLEGHRLFRRLRRYERDMRSKVTSGINVLLRSSLGAALTSDVSRAIVSKCLIYIVIFSTLKQKRPLLT